MSSAQAEDGLANGCEDGRGSWGEETRMVHTLGKSHRPRSDVAQATGIRQAGVPTGPATKCGHGMLAPIWDWQWTLPRGQESGTQVPLGGSRQGRSLRPEG